MCSMDRHWGAGQECSDVNPALPCVMGPGVCLHQSIQVQDAQARSQAQVSINITTGWGLRHAWHQSQLNHSMSQLCAAKRDISALVCLQTEHAYSEAERGLWWVVGGLTGLHLLSSLSPEGSLHAPCTILLTKRCL